MAEAPVVYGRLGNPRNNSSMFFDSKLLNKILSSLMTILRFLQFIRLSTESFDLLDGLTTKQTTKKPIHVA